MEVEAAQVAHMGVMGVVVSEEATPVDVAVLAASAVAPGDLQGIALGIRSRCNRSQSRNRRTPRQGHRRHKIRQRGKYTCRHREAVVAKAAMWAVLVASRVAQASRVVRAGVQGIRNALHNHRNPCRDHKPHTASRPHHHHKFHL